MRWVWLTLGAASLLCWPACGGDFSSDGGGGATTTSGAGAGTGMACTVDTECPAAENFCLRSFCNENGICKVNAVREGALPELLQMFGDCEVLSCDGSGELTYAEDTSDVPVDGNPCTDDVCESGAPLHPPKPANTPCGNGLECDGTGRCTGCTEANQCGDSSDCLTWECTSEQVCKANYAAAGTALPVIEQTAGDCQELRCDGMGHASVEVDDNDVPDGIPGPCRVWRCDNGTAVSDKAPNNTQCAQARICCGGTCCVLDMGSGNFCNNGQCP